VKKKKQKARPMAVARFIKIKSVEEFILIVELYDGKTRNQYYLSVLGEMMSFAPKMEVK
jgi:hypothetical protein